MNEHRSDRVLKVGTITAYIALIGACYVDMLIGWGRLRAWVYAHETLATGAIALLGTALLYWQIRLSDIQEAARRASRRRAIRVVSPLAVMQLSAYSDAWATTVRTMLENLKRDGTIGEIEKLHVPDVPYDALSVIRDLSETLPPSEAQFLAMLVAEMQIHRSRLFSALDSQNPPAVRTLETYVIDTARLSARISALYDYVRWRTNRLPTAITWSDVRAALFHAQMYEEAYPEVYRRIDLSSEGNPDRDVPSPWKSYPE